MTKPTKPCNPTASILEDLLQPKERRTWISKLPPEAQAEMLEVREAWQAGRLAHRSVREIWEAARSRFGVSVQRELFTVWLKGQL